MIEVVQALPFAFWVAFALLVFGFARNLRRMQDGTGLPTLAVLFTTTAWYVGDAFYNDYASHHSMIFADEVLAAAWWQVAFFVLMFLVLAPPVHRFINARSLGGHSSVMSLFHHGVLHSAFQQRLHQLFWGCLAIWIAVSVFAIAQLDDEAIHFFFPYLDYRADPWARNRVGTGIDALLSLSNYLQVLTGACFGLIAALARDRRVRIAALVACGIVWPYYFLGRTRNTMLAVSVPGILAWALLRLRVPMLARAATLGGIFMLFNVWFGFVMENRMSRTMMDALREKGFSSEEAEMVGEEEEVGRHQGLNMYEELCWITSFLADGSMSVNWGFRYFAELVNPIPRSLWPGKPLVGFDYAIARGMEIASESGAVHATVTSGMIGQAVLSFGRYLGPPFAALLFSIWAAILARLDLNGFQVGRIPLFALGILLTFNLGRDVTFLTLYSFVFGSLLIWVLDRKGR